MRAAVLGSFAKLAVLKNWILFLTLPFKSTQIPVRPVVCQFESFGLLLIPAICTFLECDIPLEILHRVRVARCRFWAHDQKGYSLWVRDLEGMLQASSLVELVLDRSYHGSFIPDVLSYLGRMKCPNLRRLHLGFWSDITEEGLTPLAENISTSLRSLSLHQLRFAEGHVGDNFLLNLSKRVRANLSELSVVHFRIGDAKRTSRIFKYLSGLTSLDFGGHLNFCRTTPPKDWKTDLVEGDPLTEEDYQKAEAWRAERAAEQREGVAALLGSLVKYHDRISLRSFSWHGDLPFHAESTQLLKDILVSFPTLTSACFPTNEIDYLELPEGSLPDLEEFSTATFQNSVRATLVRLADQSRFPFITALSLRSLRGLDGELVKTLATSLAPRLKSLDWSSAKLPDAAGVLLLQTATSLRKLDICYSFGDSSLIEVARSCLRLTELRCGSQSCTAACVSPLRSLTLLALLDIQQFQVPDKEMYELALSLTNLRNLLLRLPPNSPYRHDVNWASALTQLRGINVAQFLLS